MQYCASCHGPDGKSSGPTAALLKASLPRPHSDCEGGREVPGPARPAHHQWGGRHRSARQPRDACLGGIVPPEAPGSADLGRQRLHPDDVSRVYLGQIAESAIPYEAASPASRRAREGRARGTCRKGAPSVWRSGSDRPWRRLSAATGATTSRRRPPNWCVRCSRGPRRITPMAPLTVGKLIFFGIAGLYFLVCLPRCKRSCPGPLWSTRGTTLPSTPGKVVPVELTQTWK